MTKKLEDLVKKLEKLEEATMKTKEKEEHYIEVINEILKKFIRKGTVKYPHQIGDNQLVFSLHLDRVIFSEIPLTIDACKNEFNPSGLSAAVAYANVREVNNMNACIRTLVDKNKIDEFKEYLVDVALPAYLRYDEEIEMFKII